MERDKNKIYSIFPKKNVREKLARKIQINMDKCYLIFTKVLANCSRTVGEPISKKEREKDFIPSSLRMLTRKDKSGEVSGQVRTSQKKSGQVRTSQDKSGPVRTKKDKSGQVMTSQDKSRQVMTSLDKS